MPASIDEVVAVVTGVAAVIDAAAAATATVVAGDRISVRKTGTLSLFLESRVEKFRAKPRDKSANPQNAEINKRQI